jgi:hypothetical protein
MPSDEIVDGEWREIRAEPRALPDATKQEVPAAVRARARLAQAVALRDMTSSWRGAGRTVSAPSPRLWEVGSSRRTAPLWLASCGGSRIERARAAETAAINDFLSRPRRQHTPLRSI